jgi:hypothetical protein
MKIESHPCPRKVQAFVKGDAWNNLVVVDREFHAGRTEYSEIETAWNAYMVVLNREIAFMAAKRDN